MYTNAVGTKDLVHHTAKHFLSEREVRAWDQVPRGPLGATEALVEARAHGQLPPTRPEPDPRWWWPPWNQVARRAHDEGYAPRYELLIHLAGDLDSGRWAALPRNRRVTEYLGFTLVVDRRWDGDQVTSAYFSPEFTGSADLPHLAPALRAFLARRDCPDQGTSRVPPAETMP
jgi:hypothetical protein